MFCFVLTSIFQNFPSKKKKRPGLFLLVLTICFLQNFQYFFFFSNFDYFPEFWVLFRFFYDFYQEYFSEVPEYFFGFLEYLFFSIYLKPKLGEDFFSELFTMLNLRSIFLIFCISLNFAQKRDGSSILWSRFFPTMRERSYKHHLCAVCNFL